MNAQSDLTTAEWDIVLKAPAFTVLYIIQAQECSRIEAYQKMLVGINAMMAPAPTGAESALVQTVRTALGSGQVPSYPATLPSSLVEARQLTLEHCRNVVSLLVQRVPDQEATAYLDWLIAIAEAVATHPTPHHAQSAMSSLVSTLTQP